jgi:hypothetical protein
MNVPAQELAQRLVRACNPILSQGDSARAVFRVLNEAGMFGTADYASEVEGALLEEIQQREPMVITASDQPTTCPRCGLRTQPTEFYQGGAERFHRCPSCGFAFIEVDEP